MKRNTAWRQKRLQQLHEIPFANLSTDEQIEKKKLIQLEKNRKAAANSRLKRKKYLSTLENDKKKLEQRIYVLEMENNQLRAVLQAYGFNAPVIAPRPFVRHSEYQHGQRPSIPDLPIPPPPLLPQFDENVPPIITVEESGTVENVHQITETSSDTNSGIQPLSLSFESGECKQIHSGQQSANNNEEEDICGLFVPDFDTF